MPTTLVTRFGALGDLCVCSWFLAGLAEQDDTGRLAVVTKAAFADLAAAVPGVDRVVPLADGGPRALFSLAREVRGLAPDRWIDAHGVLRSRLLEPLALRRADARLAKDTAARLQLIRNPGAPPPPGLDRHLLDRFDALTTGRPGRTRLETGRPPLADLAPSAPEGPAIIGLAPGARWPSKQWPDNRFHETARTILETGDEHLRIILGPDELDWFAGSPLAGLESDARVEVVRNAPLLRVAALLGGCRAVLTNDSGLLHLAEAVGTPVTALFGPTVRAFGYAPLLPASRVLEVDLDCRPCSRTGSRACHRGDLACLDRIPATDAVAALRSVAAHREPTP